MEQQRSVVLPDYVLHAFNNNGLNAQLHLSDIGYYPKAKGHFRKRKDGAKQHILIYCISGKGWISVNGKKFGVADNQYFIIPKNTPHSYGSDSGEPWSIYWLHFLGTLSDDFANITQNPQSIFPSNIDRIQNRIELFEEMLQNLEIGFSAENIQYANICLMHFLASFKFLDQYRQIRKSNTLDKMEKSIHYMKNNLAKQITLTDLAKLAQLSVSQYALLFKKKTGKSPLDFLIQLRMQKACQLLDNTSFKIKEISQQVGYRDAYYFSRIFSNSMGIAPREYRKSPKG